MTTDTNTFVLKYEALPKLNILPISEDYESNIKFQAKEFFDYEGLKNNPITSVIIITDKEFVVVNNNLNIIDRVSNKRFKTESLSDVSFDGNENEMYIQHTFEDLFRTDAKIINTITNIEEIREPIITENGDTNKIFIEKGKTIASSLATNIGYLDKICIIKRQNKKNSEIYAYNRGRSEDYYSKGINHSGDIFTQRLNISNRKSIIYNHKALFHSIRINADFNLEKGDYMCIAIAAYQGKKLKDFKKYRPICWFTGHQFIDNDTISNIESIYTYPIKITERNENDYSAVISALKIIENNVIMKDTNGSFRHGIIAEFIVSPTDRSFQEDHKNLPQNPMNLLKSIDDFVLTCNNYLETKNVEQKQLDKDIDDISTTTVTKENKEKNDNKTTPLLSNISSLALSMDIFGYPQKLNFYNCSKSKNAFFIAGMPTNFSVDLLKKCQTNYKKICGSKGMFYLNSDLKLDDCFHNIPISNEDEDELIQEAISNFDITNLESDSNNKYVVPCGLLPELYTSSLDSKLLAVKQSLEYFKENIIFKNFEMFSRIKMACYYLNTNDINTTGKEIISKIKVQGAIIFIEIAQNQINSNSVKEYLDNFRTEHLIKTFCTLNNNFFLVYQNDIYYIDVGIGKTEFAIQNDIEPSVKLNEKQKDKIIDYIKYGNTTKYINENNPFIVQSLSYWKWAKEFDELKKNENNNVIIENYLLKKPNDEYKVYSTENLIKIIEKIESTDIQNIIQNEYRMEVLLPAIIKSGFNIDSIKKRLLDTISKQLDGYIYKMNEIIETKGLYQGIHIKARIRVYLDNYQDNNVLTLYTSYINLKKIYEKIDQMTTMAFGRNINQTKKMLDIKLRNQVAKEASDISSKAYLDIIKVHSNKVGLFGLCDVFCQELLQCVRLASSDYDIKNRLIELMTKNGDVTKQLPLGYIQDIDDMIIYLNRK